MTAPAIDRVGIEHLDRDPECVACGKTADYATDSHGCAEEFICEVCLMKVRAFVNGIFAAGARGRCTECGRRFTRWEDFITAVPL
jgi:hypothetical protein